MKKPALRNWRVVAIDPGSSPTLCAMWDRGDSIRLYDHEHTADYVKNEPHGTGKHKNTIGKQRVRAILEFHQPDLVVIEKIWVRPGQGVVSQAKLVMCMAMCEGVAAGLRMNTLMIFPQTWQKYYGLITKGKDNHRQYASLLMPQHLWALTRMKDHDRADAMLMANLGMLYLDRAYESAVRRGAPLDFVPDVSGIK